MNDDAPPSLETRMLIDSFRKDCGYPFMRAARWFIRVVAAMYMLFALFLSVGLLGDSMSTEARDAVEWAGGPGHGVGGLAAMLLLLSASIRVMLMLAASECIQLLLDMRNAQADFASTIRNPQ